MLNRKFVNTLFFLICCGICFNNIPVPLQMNFIGGPVGSYIIFYPLALGMVYTIYQQYKYRNVFVYLNKFLFFSCLYLFIVLTSTVIGLYNYPYYDLVFSGPINQIEKLPKLINLLQSVGIEVNAKVLLGFWITARVIKTVILEIFWCFGSAYMIFCWYYNDCSEGIKIFIKGIVVSLLIFLAYGFIDVFYLAGNDTAKNILEITNPYIHTIKNSIGWWPPLLWKGQLRSVFSEPSNIGNYIAAALPVLWYVYYRRQNKIWLVLSSLIVFMAVLSKARTAYAMLFGMSLLLLLLISYVKRIDLLKKYFVIILCSIFAFGCGVKFLDYAKEANKVQNNKYVTTNISKNTKPLNPKKNNKNRSNIVNKKNEVTAAKVIDENLLSLAGNNGRSNGARYALIKSNLRIAADYPLLGVGNGLATAYIVDNYTEAEKKDREVKMWVSSFYKKGVFASGSAPGTALNEYITRLAQNGIIGLSVFMFPFLFILVKLLKLLKESKEDLQLNILFIIFVMISLLVAGCNSNLNVVFAIWPLLGLSYAIYYQNKLGIINDKK